MRYRLAAALLAAFLTTPPALPAAESPLAAARSGIEQWVQTRQLVSRTKSDWESEKEMLLQTKALFERELAGVADQMSRVSTNSTQVDRERVAAEKELKDSNESLDHARQLIAGLESQVRSVTALLPAPLVETMQPLLTRLPEEAATTKVGVTERVQTVVSLLNEIDKFNNAVTLFSEKRKNEKGEEVAVETVYVGLGAAYFVNQTGDFAGAGRPGPKGWEWSIEPALADRVREVVRIYRGERTAHFVLFPVTIQ
jgi:septal ring factor EnvC (AmiA/AmiB activator)